DPVYKGHYPADMVELFGANLDGIDLSAVRVACAPTDFLGINYYSRNVVTYDESNPLKTKAINPEGSAYTDMGWEVYPQGLTDLLVRVQHDYAPTRIYITENGAAYNDPLPVNGIVEDPLRRDYYA